MKQLLSSLYKCPFQVGNYVVKFLLFVAFSLLMFAKYVIWVYIVQFKLCTLVVRCCLWTLIPWLTDIFVIK